MLTMKSTANLNQDASDGAIRVGATRIGYAYILKRDVTNPLSDLEMLFTYDNAGNQINKKIKKVN